MRRKLSALVDVTRFHSSPIFSGKALSLPLECAPCDGLIWVGFSLARKYQTRMIVSDSYTHSSFMRPGMNNDCKKFYDRSSSHSIRKTIFVKKAGTFCPLRLFQPSLKYTVE